MNTRPPSANEDILVRLRRIEGQIGGIQRMLEGGRDCAEVLTQLMAARSSIDQAGLLLMESHIERCLLRDLEADPARLQELRETIKMWARFGLLPGAALPLEQP